jgi:hypothetical protein
MDGRRRVPRSAPELFDDLLLVADRQLTVLGQALNTEKWEWIDHGEAGELDLSGLGQGRMLAEDPLDALELHAWFEEPRV